MFGRMAGKPKEKVAGLAEEPKAQTWSVEKCFMRTQNDGRSSPGKVQKMINKTAGRLGFGGNRLAGRRAGGMVRPYRTEQAIRQQLTGRMDFSRTTPGTDRS